MHAYTLIVLVTLSITASVGSAQSKADDAGLFVIGRSAQLEAGRNVEAAVVIGDDLKVAGHVEGIAAAVGGDLHVLPGAVIDGPALAIGGELQIAEGASVEGPRVTVAPGDFSQVASDLAKVDYGREAPSVAAGPAMRVAQVLSLFAIGLLLVLLTPRHVQGVRQTLEQQPGVALLVGSLVMIGLVPLCLLLAVSLVGIPLIPVAIITVVAACTLGLIALGATLGYRSRLVRSPNNLLGAMAVGLAIVGVAAAIPLFGAIAMLLMSAWGAGAALLSRFGARPTSSPAAPSSADSAAVADGSRSGGETGGRVSA